MTRDPTSIEAATVQLRRGRLTNCTFGSLQDQSAHQSSELQADQRFIETSTHSEFASKRHNRTTRGGDDAVSCW